MSIVLLVVGSDLNLVESDAVIVHTELALQPLFKAFHLSVSTGEHHVAQQSSDDLVVALSHGKDGIETESLDWDVLKFAPFVWIEHDLGGF